MESTLSGLKSDVLKKKRNIREGSNSSSMSGLQVTNYEARISELPIDNSYGFPLFHYQGFWYFESLLEGVMLAQENFKADPVDIIIASAMKTGTTWLKSLSFALVTRSRFDDSTSPLLTKVSHDCIPFMEFDLQDEKMVGRKEQLGIPLVATHMAYASLPESVSGSGCKIVYIWRDLKDVFVSLWFFVAKYMASIGCEQTLSLEENFDLFCEGLVGYGPYWDHILGYWKASLENPDKVMFLKYEDMMKNTKTHVNKLAEFLGCPFSLEEEKQGMVEKIIKLCSFENLSKLPVNTNGKHREGTAREANNNVYFRKGEMGDWTNHLTPEMGARLDEITEKRFRGSGLMP